MLAGGEFPILVPQSLGTTTIEWREFGVRLEAVPTILGGGRVRLELQPEVSERDFSNSVNVNGFTVPGLTTRRVNTQVEMKFGQTYMLAGLLSLRRTATTSKVPWLGELPWIGTAFRRVQYDEGETELVIMVTPELAGAMDPHQVPAYGPGEHTDVPTDRELYKYGLIEVPNYGGTCPDCEDNLPATRMHYATAVDPTLGYRVDPGHVGEPGYQAEPAPQPELAPIPSGTPLPVDGATVPHEPKATPVYEESIPAPPPVEQPAPGQTRNAARAATIQQTGWTPTATRRPGLIEPR
jgi:pilus assembly protein CpaC